MQINDRVYGTVTVKDPVLIMLINSKPVQRLKGINQAGASQYAIKGTNVSRYEHSVGVMILPYASGGVMAWVGGVGSMASLIVPLAAMLFCLWWLGRGAPR